MGISRLSTKTVFFYSLSGLVSSLPLLPIAIILPEWYARDLGLGLVTTGIIIALARFLDLFTDPIIGFLVDRVRWRGYRYKPFIILGALLVSAGFIFLSYPSSPVTGWHLGVGLFILYTGWSLFQIPYTSWGAVISTHSYDRTRLTGARELFGMIGLLLSIFISLVAVSYLDYSPFKTLAYAASIIAIPCIYLLIRWIPEPSFTTPFESIKAAHMRSLFKFQPCRKLFLCWFLNSLANGIPAVLLPFVITDFFQLDKNSIYSYLIAYFLAGAIGATLWIRTSKRWGKRLVWQIAIWINIFCFAQVLWMGPETSSLFWIVCVITGLTLGADLALPPSIQADVMESDRAENKVDRTAVCFSISSLISKLALSLAICIPFLGLGLAHSDTTSVPSSSILIYYVVVPIFLKASVAFILLKPFTSGESPSAA